MDEQSAVWLGEFGEAAACCVMAALFGGVTLMLALRAVNVWSYMLAGCALVFVAGMGHEFWRRVDRLRATVDGAGGDECR
jgi:hypothetical protein